MIPDIKWLSQKTGLKTSLIQDIWKRAEHYGVERIILFGSRAAGRWKRTSDIDLYIRAKRFTPFVLEVDDESPTLLKFDFIDAAQNLDPEFFREIEKTGIVFYEKV